MHRLAVGAFAGFAALAGCLGAQTRQCKNGATCPYDEACTEVAIVPGAKLCGDPTLVGECMTKPRFSACTYQVAQGGNPAIDGACLDNVCVECTTDVAGCIYAGWSAMRSNVSANLRHIWVGARDYAVAVGEARTVLFYDGRAWRSSKIPDLPDNTTLNAVWAADPSRLYVVTADGKVLEGTGTGIERTWTVATQTMSGTPLLGISGSGPGDIVAVGLLGAILHFNGSAWNPVNSGVSQTLNDVWVIDAQDAWAVGVAGVILRRQAGTWSVSRPANGATQKNLNGVWAPSPTEAYAVGDSDGADPQILQFSGSWVTQNVPRSALNVTSVWGAESRIFASSEKVIFDYKNPTWNEIPTQAPVELQCVRGTSASDVFVVGDTGTILHYSNVD